MEGSRNPPAATLHVGFRPPPFAPCARDTPCPQRYSLPRQHPSLGLGHTTAHPFWSRRATPLTPGLTPCPASTPFRSMPREPPSDSDPRNSPSPVRTPAPVLTPTPPPVSLARPIEVRHAINLLSQPGLYILFRHFGALAQLVARFHGMEEVRGSNPLCST